MGAVIGEKSLHRELWGEEQETEVKQSSRSDSSLESRGRAGCSRQWEQQKLWQRGVKAVWEMAGSSGLLGCKGQNWYLVELGSWGTMKEVGEPKRVLSRGGIWSNLCFRKMQPC